MAENDVMGAFSFGSLRPPAEPISPGVVGGTCGMPGDLIVLTRPLGPPGHTAATWHAESCSGKCEGLL